MMLHIQIPPYDWSRAKLMGPLGTVEVRPELRGTGAGNATAWCLTIGPSSMIRWALLLPQLVDRELSPACVNTLHSSIMQARCCAATM